MITRRFETWVTHTETPSCLERHFLCGVCGVCTRIREAIYFCTGDNLCLYSVRSTVCAVANMGKLQGR